MTEGAMSFGFVFGLILLVIAAAFYIPFVVEDPTLDRQRVINQSENEEITLINNLNATVTDVNDTQADVTVRLNDTDTGADNSSTITAGGEEDIILEGETITVNSTGINTGDSAELTYTYPPTYAWPAGMKTVADNLAIIVMGLIGFILFGYIWLD